MRPAFTVSRCLRRLLACSWILVRRLLSQVLLLTGDGLRSKVIFKLLMAGPPSPLSFARDSTWWSGMFAAGTGCGRSGEGSKG